MKLTENVSDSPASTENGTEAGQTTADTDKIIPQENDFVNKQYIYQVTWIKKMLSL